MPVDFSVEKDLILEYGSVACVDEVGRGALAGPVCAGAVLLSDPAQALPVGVNDSKQLSAKARVRILPAVKSWPDSWCVGSASPQEVDELGIVMALRTAALRALKGLTHEPGVVLLDGPHDYISGPGWDVPVRTLVRADATCVGVAAASVIAKVSRDSMMEDLAGKYPQYRWEKNKGYGSAEHRAAILQYGASDHHRHSWDLTGKKQA